MTPSTLTNNLWRAASEVKSFLEKMPNGASLTVIKDKVGAYKSLKVSDKKKLIDFLQQRESVIVYEAKAEKATKPTTFLRHKKFGWPKVLDGYGPVLKPILDTEKLKKCSKCGNKKPLNEFYANNTNNDRLQSYCKECVKISTADRQWKKGENYGKRKENTTSEEANMNTKINSVTETSEKPLTTPESLRKQAEKLLREAEEAELAAKSNDAFNKKIQPLRLELLQKVAAAQSNFDKLMDSMADLEKSAEKLRDFAI